MQATRYVLEPTWTTRIVNLGSKFLEVSISPIKQITLTCRGKLYLRSSEWWDVQYLNVDYIYAEMNEYTQICQDAYNSEKSKTFYVKEDSGKLFENISFA